MIPNQLQPLANHLWQSTLFAAVATLLTLALRKNRAQTRYWLWLAASLKFLIPFSLLVDVGSHWGRHAAPAITPPVLSYVIEQASQPFSVPTPLAATTAAPASSLLDWVPAVLSTVWAIGFATLICSWWRRWRGLRAALRTASPLDLQIGMGVMVSPAFAEPGVFGVRRPVLLLPAGITDRLTPPQLKAIVVHELCHVRRRDNLATAIHMGVEALFWFHPLVWWLGARLMEERERACDEEVLLMGSEPEAYAEGILQVCELYLESPLACVSGVAGANLRKRIEGIMSKRIGIRLSFAKKFGLSLAGAATLAMPIVIGMTGTQATATPQDRPTSQKPLAFEAASVKPASVPDGITANGNTVTVRKGSGIAIPRNTGGPGTADPGRIHYPLISLKGLLSQAYDSYFEIVCPGWLDTQFVQVDATLPPNTTKEQFREMLRNLIADRFKLKYHADTKEISGYALVIAKNGPKIKESPNAPVPQESEASGPPERPPIGADGFPTRSRLDPGKAGTQVFMGQGGRRRLYAQQQTMHDFAAFLESQLRQDAGPNTPRVSVINATGLTAKYDFTLTFSREATPDAEAFADIFGAMQSQLGLKLEQKKTPVQVIVIDHMEKVPTEN